MNETPITVHAEDVPRQYAVCFNDQCPLRQECVRYAAGEAVATVNTHGPCVYPSALQGDKCPMFRQLRLIRLAWGFKPLFADVRHADYAKVRSEVIFYFKSESDFWRYNRGYYKLTPKQQQDILEIFRRHGYDPSKRHFRHAEERVDF